MFDSLFKISPKTVFTKSFFLGLIQIAAGATMIKFGMVESGATIIATGFTTIGIRDAITKQNTPKE